MLVLRFSQRCVVVAVLLLGSLGLSTNGLEAASPNLDGRLGGSVSSLRDRFGVSDSEEQGLIRFNVVPTSAGDATLVAYHDQEFVTKLVLVWTEQPTSLADTDSIPIFGKEFAPKDGVCGFHTVGAPNLTHSWDCHSDALVKRFTPELIESMGYFGAAGEFTISMDPIDDEYFEISLQPGNKLDSNYQAYEEGTAAGSSVTSTSSSSSTRVTSPAALVGRLGGTRAELEARFGPTTGQSYSVDGLLMIVYSLDEAASFAAHFEDFEGAERVQIIALLITINNAAEGATALNVMTGILAPSDAINFSTDSSGMLLVAKYGSSSLDTVYGSHDFTVTVALTNGNQLSIIYTVG